MNGTNFEAVVEEFRQYIIEQNVAHLNYVANLIKKADEKETMFREYVKEQANWGGKKGYMRKVYFALTGGRFGESAVGYDNYNKKPYDLFYGHRQYMREQYPWYFKMVEKYTNGRKAVDDETEEEMFLRIATDDANKSIENFMTKVEEKAGSIEGAKELYIMAGNINGIVVGSNADVKVTTFGAGGYNIQRFHFRTKVTALKQRA